MTQYVGAGALIDGTRPATKKALREALRDKPASVTFDVTDAFGPYAGKTLTVAEVTAGMAVQVAGPEPRVRKWNARVEINGPDNTVKITA